MPTRSRSHQLEDLSLTRFRALLPTSWVVRRKDQDYGIDLEVEVFEEDGRSTGFIFLVQVRATDNRKRGNRVRLTVEQLRYFRTLGLPVLVVRYLSDPGGWYAQWAWNMGHGLKSGQASFTHCFVPRDAWSGNMPDRIMRTLLILKTVERPGANGRVGLRINQVGLNGPQRFLLEAAIDDTVSLVGRPLHTTEDPTHVMAVDLGLTANSLCVSLDCIASATFHGVDLERTELRDRILYGLILIYQSRNLDRLTASLATAALLNGIAPPSRELAYVAAIGLAPDLKSMVRIAKLGRVHEEHDPIYADFVARLLKTDAPVEARREAVEDFYVAAIECAAQVAQEREGAVRYSLANYLRNDGRNIEGLREYVRAKRLRPSYLATGYFLHEIGVCLYNLSRHNCARIAYKRSIDAGCDSQRARLHLADATLLCSNIRDAISVFDAASSGDDELATSEAKLKALTCEWLMELVGSGRLKRERRTDDLDLEATDDDLLSVVRGVDGLDCLAHYNLGILKASQHLWPEAIGHFLIAAFVFDQDLDAWANAIICAWNIGIPELIIAIIATATSLAGRSPYDRLRETLIGQDAPAGMLEALTTFLAPVRQRRVRL